MLKGRRLAPIDFYEAGRKSLHFVGYEGMSMIAVAGLHISDERDQCREQAATQAIPSEPARVRYSATYQFFGMAKK